MTQTIFPAAVTVSTAQFLRVFSAAQRLAYRPRLRCFPCSYLAQFFYAASPLLGLRTGNLYAPWRLGRSDKCTLGWLQPVTTGHSPTLSQLLAGWYNWRQTAQPGRRGTLLCTKMSAGGLLLLLLVRRTAVAAAANGTNHACRVRGGGRLLCGPRSLICGCMQIACMRACGDVHVRKWRRLVLSFDSRIVVSVYLSACIKRQVVAAGRGGSTTRRLSVRWCQNGGRRRAMEPIFHDVESGGNVERGAFHRRRRNKNGVIESRRVLREYAVNIVYKHSRHALSCTLAGGWINYAGAIHKRCNTHA